MIFDRLHPLAPAPRRLALAVVIAVCLVSLQCSRSPTSPGTGPVTPGVTPPAGGGPTPNTSSPFIFVGAGDIANCDDPSFAATPNTSPLYRKTWRDASEQTARLIDSIGGDVFTLGDNAYPLGRAQDFSPCYAQTWGRFANRTHPSPGNHDYGDDKLSEANAYFNYFGPAAGDFGKGYYSFDGGGWHIISLNSNFGALGGALVDTNSVQANWLRQDLAAHPAKCTMAYWHHPRFNSGPYGDFPQMQAIFRILYDAGADVVLAGHEHLYERFAPQTPEGVRDDARGIRQFTIGTGGTVPMRPVMSIKGNSERRVPDNWGVVKFTLTPDAYSWEFISTTNGALDSGSASCH